MYQNRYKKFNINQWTKIEYIPFKLVESNQEYFLNPRQKNRKKNQERKSSKYKSQSKTAEENPMISRYILFIIINLSGP